jgi:hypothetical protein
VLDGLRHRLVPVREPGQSFVHTDPGIGQQGALRSVAGDQPRCAPVPECRTHTANAEGDPTGLVNPFVGSGSGGVHTGQVDTFPGATAPFGMLSLVGRQPLGRSGSACRPRGWDTRLTRELAGDIDRTDRHITALWLAPSPNSPHRTTTRAHTEPLHALRNWSVPQQEIMCPERARVRRIRVRSGGSHTFSRVSVLFSVRPWSFGDRDGEPGRGRSRTRSEAR